VLIKAAHEGLHPRGPTGLNKAEPIRHVLLILQQELILLSAPQVVQLQADAPQEVLGLVQPLPLISGEEPLALQHLQPRIAAKDHPGPTQNVQVAQSVYESYFNKYKQGMLSSLDLTQANSNYLQAENNYISSMLKLLQARLALEKLYNTL